MNVFEVVFIVIASAFALEEYTASKEHGWTSEFSLPSCLCKRPMLKFHSSLYSECEQSRCFS